MRTLLPTLLIIGLIIWGFLLWDRSRPDQYARDFADRASEVELDDATTADRCARFRTASDDDDAIWSLGYMGRIQQLFSGCF